MVCIFLELVLNTCLIIAVFEIFKYSLCLLFFSVCIEHDKELFCGGLNKTDQYMVIYVNSGSLLMELLGKD